MLGRVNASSSPIGVRPSAAGGGPPGTAGRVSASSNPIGVRLVAGGATSAPRRVSANNSPMGVRLVAGIGPLLITLNALRASSLKLIL